ncbi:hypothetical protein [Zunongwangia endophytica]|uniref:DUF3857 domain-containing protein n=1 Tax=Zunongwangia endophytica TaxID=1808945 RepID=A0ABV8HBG9_9FLAO|nr:hypothetical protein [Zunongwangia endophytica]MDN3594208.1 hypothetical protein [Zunongwangia endophytica]
MKSKFIIIAMLLIALSGYSQIQFVNKTSSEPIPNVKVFNKDGKILSVSNSNGISRFKKNELLKNDTVNIFHSNFEIKYLPYKDLLKKDRFLLSPSDYENLQEVVITSKNPRYLKITGYYISYQLIDNKPQSFSDGIIEYFIDTKKSKVKDYNIKESRIFKDKSYISELKKAKPKAVSMLGSNLLPFTFEEEILLSEWKNRDETFSEMLNEDWVGNIENENDGSVLTIEYYTPENPRKISLLGLKTVINHHLIQEEFSSNETKIASIKRVTKYFSSEREKKDEKINYELEQDFFVNSIQYMNREKFKLATVDISHDTNTNFSSDFWTTFQSFIPPTIQQKLYHNMELIKK